MAAEAALALGAVRAALWCVPYRTVQRWAGPANGAADVESRVAALQVAQAIARAEKRMPWRSTCLVQALAAQWMLSRRRSQAWLRLGVAREGQNDLRAHAWLESAGILVTGGPQEHVARYAVLGATERNVQ